MTTSRKTNAAQNSSKIELKKISEEDLAKIPEEYECLPHQFFGAIQIFPSETSWRTSNVKKSLYFCRVLPPAFCPDAVYVLPNDYKRYLRYLTQKERKALAKALGVELKLVEAKYKLMVEKEEKEYLEEEIKELHKQAAKLGYNIQKLKLKEKAAIAKKTSKPSKGI